MSHVLLNVQELSKQYKKFTFGPINFHIEQGTVVALVGPNGSGKSTFFRLIMNLIQPDQGTIAFLGKNMQEHEVISKQQIGYVGSALYTIFGHLTIRKLAVLVGHWYPNWDRKRYEQLVTRYDIDVQEKYGHCSTGTQKKVHFIFALAHHPRLLLLDEPSAGMDILSQGKMKEDLLDFMEDGQNSIIIATHLQEEIQQMSDYVCLLNKGEIIHTFEKDEVHDQWARLWISTLPERLKDHPNIYEVNENPVQIVTDHLPDIKDILEDEQVRVTHIQRLELIEVLGYYLYKREEQTEASEPVNLEL